MIHRQVVPHDLARDLKKLLEIGVAPADGATFFLKWGTEPVSRAASRIWGSVAVNSPASAADRISGGDSLTTSG